MKMTLLPCDEVAEDIRARVRLGRPPTYVVRLSAVLDVYQQPDDPRFPQVCMDETSKQRVRETRTPLPRRRANRRASTMNTSGVASPISSSRSSHWQVAGRWRSRTTAPGWIGRTS